MHIVGENTNIGTKKTKCALLAKQYRWRENKKRNIADENTNNGVMQLNEADETAFVKIIVVQPCEDNLTRKYFLQHNVVC